MVLNIYNCEAQNYLIHFILRQSKPIIEKVIDEKSKNTNIKEEDKDFHVGILCRYIFSKKSNAVNTRQIAYLQRKRSPQRTPFCIFKWQTRVLS